MQEKQHVNNQQSYILLYSAYHIQVEVSKHDNSIPCKTTW